MSQSDILKLKRLTLNSRRRRGNPIRDLANFSDRLHQAAHVLAVFDRLQPLRFLCCERFLRNQIAFNVEMMSRIFTDVAMEADIGQVQKWHRLQSVVALTD